MKFKMKMKRIVWHGNFAWIAYRELVVSVDDALVDAPDDFSALFSGGCFCLGGLPRCPFGFFVAWPAFFGVVVMV